MPMSKDNKILNDLCQVASSTVASVINIKNDLSTYATGQVKTMLKDMDFVSKKDFAALKKMVEKLHAEVQLLKGFKDSSAVPAPKKILRKKI